MSGMASRAFALLLGVLAAVPPAIGQEVDTKAYAQQLVDAGENTVAHLLNVFRPNFPREKRYLLSSNRVGVHLAADFNAFAKYDTEEVIIPAQLVAEIFAEVQAQIYVKNHPSSGRRLDRWTRYLTERSAEAMRKYKAGEVIADDGVVEPFWSYARLPTPPNLDAQDEALQQQMMIEALGLIVAHELGHLALGHKDYTGVTAQVARRQEDEADDFAARLMQRSDLSILPGVMTVFMRFVYAEALFAEYDEGTSTHRSGPCRMYRMLGRYLDEDVAVVRNGAQRPQSVQAFMDKAQAECNDG